MNSFKISSLIAIVVLGGFFAIGWALSSSHKVIVEQRPVESPIREVHNYIDYTGYYDTVIFTEEDSILSIY